MRKCPNCGSPNIKEEVDKTKIIGYMLHEPVYEKNLVCKNCTHRWKPGEEVAKVSVPETVTPEPTAEEPESPSVEPEPTAEEPELPSVEPEPTAEEPESPPEEPPMPD